MQRISQEFVFVPTLIRRLPPREFMQPDKDSFQRHTYLHRRQPLRRIASRDRYSGDQQSFLHRPCADQSSYLPILQNYRDRLGSSHIFSFKSRYIAAAIRANTTYFFFGKFLSVTRKVIFGRSEALRIRGILPPSKAKKTRRARPGKSLSTRSSERFFSVAKKIPSAQSSRLRHEWERPVLLIGTFRPERETGAANEPTSRCGRRALHPVQPVRRLYPGIFDFRN